MSLAVTAMANITTATDGPEITVLYFAAASTATGLSVERVILPITPPPVAQPRSSSSTTAQGTPAQFPLSSLGALLSARHPNTALADILAQSGWAVNEEMVDDPQKVYLRGGEEVAIICPVSGG